MSGENSLMKSNLKVLWSHLKRYMMATSYPLPRLPFYQSQLPKFVFKVIFSNLAEFLDILCILANTGIILAHISTPGSQLPFISRCLTIIFGATAGLRLLAVRWHKAFERRLVLLQVCIAAASLVTFL